MRALAIFLSLLLVGALVPVLFLTLNIVVPKLGGQTLPGPLDDSIFMHMGGPASLLIPLALFSATLAGHGFRERLAYYLLAASWLATLSGVGAFFLGTGRVARMLALHRKAGGAPRGQPTS